MKKLIKIDGYWIVLSDEEIKHGQLGVFNCGYAYNPCLIFDENIHDKEHFKPYIFSNNLAHNLPTITFSDEVTKELGSITKEEYFCELETEWITNGDEEHDEGGTLPGSIESYEQPKIENNSVKIIKIWK